MEVVKMGNRILETYKGHNIILDSMGYIFIENWCVCMGNKLDIKKGIACSKRKVTSLVKKGLI